MRLRRFLRRLAIALLVLLALVVGAGVLAWRTFVTGEPQAFQNADARFAYGSLGGELFGIPYPLFMILPRVFPDLVARYATEGYGPGKPGYGGYGAFGLSWEQGQALPVGFSIRRAGLDRVTVNCALCHTASWRLDAEDDRHFALGGPAHAANIQGLLRFLVAASHDRRFSAARLLPEIALNFPLDGLDYPLYALVVIPATRLALHQAGKQLGWMEGRTGWGPGRDDAFNLAKFILTQSPWDDGLTITDFPALWQMGKRDGGLVHAGGEARTVYAVSATSALGTGALPFGEFEARNDWLVAYLRDLKPPPFPRPVDPALAAAGQAIFTTRCAECHEPGGARTGRAIPLDEIGTDPEHARGWTERDAERMNRLTATLGVERAELQGAQGYVAKPLVGVWLLGPYLHNGSVPTLWDLLSPAERRPAMFWRGYDVIDPERVGFVATGPDAQAAGFRHDTGSRGNGNGGHAYGTDLDDAGRRALIEYLKTR